MESGVIISPTVARASEVRSQSQGQPRSYTISVRELRRALRRPHGPAPPATGLFSKARRSALPWPSTTGAPLNPRSTKSAVSALTLTVTSTQTTSCIVTAEIGGTLGAQRAVKWKTGANHQVRPGHVLQGDPRYAEWLTYI